MPEATPTTKLAAVNIMLSTVGAMPVNSLETNLPGQAILAQQILDEVDLDVATRGWHFNTESDYTLLRAIDGRILIPENIIRAWFSKQTYPNLDLTMRRDTDLMMAFYDKVTHSFQMPSDLTATVVLLFPFEDAPESYRRYVTCRAARIFQDRSVGSQPHHVYNTMDENVAERWLKRHEGTQQVRTIFDTYDAVRPLIRQYPFLRRI